jgi:hypothetical protein
MSYWDDLAMLVPPIAVIYAIWCKVIKTGHIMANSGNPRDYVQEVHIRYEGRIADQNALPLDDLIESLRGWELYFDLTASILIRGNLDPRPLPMDRRPQLRIREVRSGSVEAVLVYVGLAAAGGIVGGASWDGIKLFARKMANFRKEALQRHLEVKKMSDGAIEQAAAALREMADQAQYRDRSRDDSVETVKKLDNSLNLATHLIDHSVNNISVTDPEFNLELRITKRERRIIATPFAEVTQSEDMGEWEERKIRISRLNIISGSCSFSFIKPMDDDEKGLHQTTITDLSLRRRCDPYSKSLYERGAIPVWVRKVTLDLDTGVCRWELMSAPPANPTSLFTA